MIKGCYLCNPQKPKGNVGSSLKSKLKKYKNKSLLN